MRLLRDSHLALGLCAIACGRIETNVGAESPKDAAAEIDATLAPPDAGAPSPYLEAEDGALSGFTIASDPAASGGKYILPPPDARPDTVPGTARAEYSFAVAIAGTYRVWGRIQAPSADQNAFWVTVDDGTPHRWQLSTGRIWFWGAVTSDRQYDTPVDYTLSAGPHRLVFQNAVPGVGLDRIFIGPPGEVPPGNTTLCTPPHSIQLDDGGCEPSCGSHGNTTCGSICTGQTALVSYDCDVCCHVPEAGAETGADASAIDATTD